MYFTLQISVMVVVIAGTKLKETQSSVFEKLTLGRRVIQTDHHVECYVHAVYMNCPRIVERRTYKD